MPKKKEEHWALAALRQRLSEATQVIKPPARENKDGETRVLSMTKKVDWEYGTVFLFDPEIRKEIDEFFYGLLYPLILTVFKDEPFQIPGINEIKLTDDRSRIEATRHALFIMSDPERPVSATERPWWSVRHNLDIYPYEYSLKTELLLSLPYWVESDWVLDFLIDARNWNNPPTLTPSQEGLTISFYRGYGTSYCQSEEDWLRDFAEPFKKHLQIAKAVDRFTEAPTNRFLRSNMFQTITEMYQGY